MNMLRRSTTRALATLALSALPLAFAGCGQGGGSSSGGSTPPGAATSGDLSALEDGLAEQLSHLAGLGEGDYVPWNEAAGAIGRVERVCGPIADIRFDVGDTHLRLGEGDAVEQFGIVVWNAPALVEDLSTGDSEPTIACIKGKVTRLDGILQIETRKPKDLRLL